MTTGRRRFLVTASGALTAVAAATIIDVPNGIAQPKVQWRMSTAYPACSTSSRARPSDWLRWSRK
jgi:hypothetical protein